jgi:hypothetical protein
MSINRQKQIDRMRDILLARPPKLQSRVFGGQVVKMTQVLHEGHRVLRAYLWEHMESGGAHLYVTLLGNGGAYPVRIHEIIDEDIDAIALAFDQACPWPREVFEGQRVPAKRIGETWLESEVFVSPDREKFTRRCYATIDGTGLTEVVYCTVPDNGWPADRFRAMRYWRRDDGESFASEGWVDISGTTEYAPTFRFVPFAYSG